MPTEYVEQRDGGYFIRDTRVSLDSVVYAFLRGESPEGITESFPALNLEQVFGALAFYMANREIVDEYLRQGQGEFEGLRRQAQLNNPALYRKPADARSVDSSDRPASRGEKGAALRQFSSPLDALSAQQIIQAIEEECERVEAEDDAAVRDQQFHADALAGRLDAIADQALKDFSQGRSTDL